MSVSKMVLLISWISKFTLLWLLTFKVLSRDDLFVWAMLFVFFLISFLSAGSVSVENKKLNE